MPRASLSRFGIGALLRGKWKNRNAMRGIRQGRIEHVAVRGITSIAACTAAANRERTCTVCDPFGY